MIPIQTAPSVNAVAPLATTLPVELSAAGGAVARFRYGGTSYTR